MKAKKLPYCNPYNAGLASETSAVCKRLSRLIDALSDEINANIAEGQIVDDLWKFRTDMIQKLTAEGWTMSFDGGNKLKVRDPQHKKPFTKGMR